MNNLIKRIGIDARFYGPIGKGLGRYTREIVDNIIKLDAKNEYVVFLRKENFSDFECRAPNVKKVLADIQWYGFAEQIILPFYILREQLDLIHFPHFNVPIFCPVKFIVTIHDLILMEFSTTRATTLGDFTYKIKNLAYRMAISSALRKSEAILTVSEYVKNAIVRNFKIKPEKIVLTYEGVSDLTSGEQSGQPVGGNYLLYIGNAYPHKNLERLIKIFSEINRDFPGLKLVLVGKEDYFYARLKLCAKNFSDNVVFYGYASDNELRSLYKNALAYVFPSFCEGFGLPPLEAMSLGLPVASSDKTCLPEILGQAALYFNPEDESDMKNKIVSLITDEKLRENLRNRGYEQAKKYDWQNCAAKTLEIYKKTLQQT